ncbi:MAG: glucosamine-6-phosphate deaminase [Candidatus Limiplasma sp.]|nr:glucosamine-6-phosphate deaminase [Candidatus Limiplasma sp.]MEA5146194.1 glucosamine-6-phosphate deaminase [Candidatus Limiplasma sp.]
MSYYVDQLLVTTFENRQQMGATAAQEAAEVLRTIIAKKGHAVAMFAAAFSQSEVLSGLVASDVDWTRVTAFHMDNYIGLPLDAPQQFSSFLTQYLFGKLPFGQVHLLGNTEDDALRYAALLEENPLDVCFLGVGENGHLAFNDPHVADFNDPLLVKRVELDEVCRNQQVRDKCFATLEDVPRSALTVTIPALLSAKEIFCTVPALPKADAVRAMLTGPVSESCPASILRRHPSTRLYLDPDSSSKL